MQASHVVNRQSSRAQQKRNPTMPSSTVWLRLLQIGLVCFNNPVYVFEYVNEARRFFGIVGVILQVLFMAILMSYWVSSLVFFLSSLSSLSLLSLFSLSLSSSSLSLSLSSLSLLSLTHTHTLSLSHTHTHTLSLSLLSRTLSLPAR